jgi:hypothetical protein
MSAEPGPTCRAANRLATERLLPNELTASNRPQAARRASPKLPEAQPGFSAFRFYEAAVRDLRQPATSRRPIALQPTFAVTGVKAELTLPGARRAVPKSLKQPFGKQRCRRLRTTAPASASHSDEQAQPTQAGPKDTFRARLLDSGERSQLLLARGTRPRSIPAAASQRDSWPTRQHHRPRRTATAPDVRKPG